MPALEATQQELEAWYTGAISEGFAAPDGWKLGLEDDDSIALMVTHSVAKECDARGLELPMVRDRRGRLHQFDSLEQLTDLVIDYIQHRAMILKHYHNKTIPD